MQEPWLDILQNCIDESVINQGIWIMQTLTSRRGVLMSMCSKTVNSFLVFMGRSHGLCSSAFTQKRTLPCFPSNEVARGLHVRDTENIWIRIKIYISSESFYLGPFLTDTHICGSSKLNAYSCLPEWIVVSASSELSSSETEENNIPNIPYLPKHWSSSCLLHYLYYSNTSVKFINVNIFIK